MKKQVLVTGANKGIGYEIARHLGKSGWQVVVGARCEDRALKAMEALRAEGADVAGWQYVNLADNGEIEVSAREIAEKYPGLSLLVNNAGIAQQKLFTDITPEEWQHMLDVNLSGAFHLCQLALPGMIRRKAGRILTVSSMWGQTGGSCEVHYSAAKSALIGLTKALARELAPSNIQVNCIAPGVIDTKMNASLGEETLELLKEESPMGRFGTPKEVAHLMLFLAGDGSDFITGQTIGIDGAFI